MKQVDAGVLNVGYAEAGPTDGPAVILLHGWPYDIHSYVDFAPLLAEAGYRAIVPYLRGYGTTCFLSGETFRNGQQSEIAVDVIALMDALGIERAIRGGCDWGLRGPALAAGTEIVAVTTDLTRQKVRETNHLDRSHFVDDPRTLPAMVRHLISAHGQFPGG